MQENLGGGRDSDDRALTVLWSQKLGRGGTVTSGNAPGNAAKHPPTHVPRGQGARVSGSPVKSQLPVSEGTVFAWAVKQS